MAVNVYAAVQNWLIARFREHRSWDFGELSQAAKDAGITKKELFEIKKRLPICAQSEIGSGGVACWRWIAKEGWPTS